MLRRLSGVPLFLKSSHCEFRLGICALPSFPPTVPMSLPIPSPPDIALFPINEESKKKNIFLNVHRGNIIALPEVIAPPPPSPCCSIVFDFPFAITPPCTTSALALPFLSILILGESEGNFFLGKVANQLFSPDFNCHVVVLPLAVIPSLESLCHPVWQQAGEAEAKVGLGGLRSKSINIKVCFIVFYDCLFKGAARSQSSSFHPVFYLLFGLFLDWSIEFLAEIFNPSLINIVWVIRDLFSDRASVCCCQSVD